MAKSAIFSIFEHIDPDVLSPNYEKAHIGEKLEESKLCSCRDMFRTKFRDARQMPQAIIITKNRADFQKPLRFDEGTIDSTPYIQGVFLLLIPYAIKITTVAISKLVVFTPKKRLKFLAQNRQKSKYPKF